MDRTAIDELVSIRDWIRFGASQFEHAGLFFGHGTDNAWDEAATVVLWVIKTPWEKLPHVLEARLVRPERERVWAIIEARIETRKPLAYLTGEAHFAGLTFWVNEHVLVPRSPLAELIAQNFTPWLTETPATVLDLCTGSGCIGIACAYAFETCEVTLSDISPEAILVAKHNIERHGLQTRVRAVESDLFEYIDGRFDLIVSNPPYVDATDMAALPTEYLAEPSLALASGDDGLDFTRRLLKQAQHHLNARGLLVVEVGNSWTALEEAFPDVPFTWLEFERGGHGVFTLTREELEHYQAAFES